MDDLEEELLQVAGRSQAGNKKRSRKADSDEDSDVLDLDSDDDDEGPSRSRKGSRSKKSKAAESEDEDDDEFGDGYGPDLIGDEEDRKKLEAMTELDREMILAERAEARQQLMQRKALLRQARGETDKPKAAPQQKQRQSSRQKKASATKDTAIKQIEEARRKQKKRQESEEGDEEEVSVGEESAEEEEYKSEGEDDDEDEGSEEEEEDDEAPAARRPVTRRSGRGQETTPARELPDEDEGGVLTGVRRKAYDDDEHHHHDDHGMDDDEPAECNELRAIQLTRDQLEIMVDKPFFDGDGLNGALVRMAYGPPSVDPDGQQVPTYWMMQIRGIVEGKSTYPFGKEGAPCSKRLVLKDGANIERTLPMSNVSNKQLEEAEVQRYARHAGRVNDKPITKYQAGEVKKKLADYAKFIWDKTQVKERIARNREAGFVANIAQEKQRLRRLLQEAHSKPDRDEDEVAQLQAQLDALDQKAALKVVTSKVSMAAINQRNKAANFNVTIRNLGTAPAGATQRKGGVDPFSRRVTRPNIYWSTGNSGKAGNTQNGDANGNAAQKPEDLEPPTAVKLKHGQTRMDPVKLVQELALDIDVSQLQNVSIVPPLHLKVLGPRWHHSLAHYSQADLSGRTLLTVADWQARAGGAGADE